MTLAHCLTLGAILFAIAIVGIFLNRKNLIVLLMAIELMLENPADLTHHTDEVRQNIRELDALVEEILLASRLDTLSLDELRREPVDLTQLAADGRRMDGRNAVGREQG